MIEFGTNVVAARGRAAWLITGVVAAVLVGGCVAEQPPSTSPSAPSAAPSATPGATPAATPVATVRPSPSASSSPTESALPAIGVAPEGRWTQVQWIDAGHGLPALTTAPSEAFQLSLYGWTNGYVAFGSDGGANSGTNSKPTLTSTSSADGVTWTPPQPIDLGGAPDEVTIEQVVEGPAGLVAVGRYPADTCGGPPVVAGLWHSADGETWSPLAMTKDMTKGHVETVDGGAAGYIATGKQRDGKTPGIWLTTDAASWHPLPLPKPAKGKLVVNDAVSFSGGLVVGGAVVGPEGCGGASSIHPAVWSSTDGTSWTSQSIPGASTGANASISVRRVNDHEVAAVDSSGDTPKVWVSSDGQTWTPIATPTDDALYGAVSNGKHTVAVIAPDSDQGPLTFESVGDQLDVAPITQSGDGPLVTPDSASYVTAVGPTGLLVLTTDGSHVWLGVPSAS